MLTRLAVDNFKTLLKFEFEAPRLAVLVGPNGSGKSAIGDALLGIGRLLNDGLPANEAFPSHTLCQWTKSSLQTFDLHFATSDGTFGYRLDILHAANRGSARIATEQLTLNGALLFEAREGEVKLFGDDSIGKPRTTFPFDKTRSFIPLLEERPDNVLTRRFRELARGLVVVHINPFAMTGRSEHEERRLAPDASNLAAYYRWFQQARPERLQPYFDSLRRVFPQFRTLRSEDAGSNVKELRAVFVAPSGETVLPLELLSEGQRQLLCLYLILQNVEDSTFIFLDEPDNFLARREVQPFLLELEDVLGRTGAQALVASHGVDALDFLDSRDAFTLRRPDGARTQIERFDGSAGTKASSWIRFFEEEEAGIAK